MNKVLKKGTEIMIKQKRKGWLKKQDLAKKRRKKYERKHWKINK